MGQDKALLKIDGAPLWKRQISVLQELELDEIFLAGPSREEWRDQLIIADAQSDAGPLAGIVSALRRTCSSHLVALAIDLPNMTATYLRALMHSCSEDSGVVPRSDRFEPLSAVYPTAGLALAEDCLRSGDYSLQNFVARAASKGLVRPITIHPADRRLFANVNTPADLLIATRHE